MSVQILYDRWSTTYDTVENKTRDLEKQACRTVLGDLRFKRVLELGAGTGKNTVWLAEHAEQWATSTPRSMRHGNWSLTGKRSSRRRDGSRITVRDWPHSRRGCDASAGDSPPFRGESRSQFVTFRFTVVFFLLNAMTRVAVFSGTSTENFSPWLDL